MDTKGKKLYVDPWLEIVVFQCADAVALSGLDNGSGDNDIDWENWA